MFDKDKSGTLSGK